MRATTPILLALGLACMATSAAAAPSARKVQMLERMRELRPAAAPAAAAPKPVLVDCTKGDSLQTALEKNPGDGLVFEVRGLCTENVRVERRRLTLRGLDPATDGIRGVAADPPATAALQVWYSELVRIENLSITHTGAPGFGLGVWYSGVEAVNCQMVGNPGHGVHVSGSGFLNGIELTMSSNGQDGLHATRNALAICRRCQLHGNALWAATSAAGAALTLLDSVVTGTRGIQATSGAYADIDCLSEAAPDPCTLNATRTAGAAFTASQAGIFGAGPFAGQLTAFDHGQIYTHGAQQTATGTGPSGNPLANNFDQFSTLVVEPSRDGQQSALAGNTGVRAFSRALLLDASTVNGTLTCHSAGDAWRDPGVTGTITGCEHAPPPAP